MDVFELRRLVIKDYESYVSSFLTIRDERIRDLVRKEFEEGHLWPEPLVQLSPAFEPGETLEDLITQGVLHPECLKIFARKDEYGSPGTPIRLHRHQVEGIHAARAGDNYVLTTGTGSGKSLSYIVPIVDYVLRRPHSRTIKAIVVYPMNALANSQMGELEKFLCRGYPEGKPPVRFRRYTGQESKEERDEIINDPPDILLTNYVMLELILTRPWERKLVEAARGLKFLVLDELHTYRGRQGADVALLVRRVREACQARELLYVGTSATLAGGETWGQQQKEVAEVASLLFGAPVKPERVIGETLRRITPTLGDDQERFLHALREAIQQGDTPPADDRERFLQHPLCVWIESTLGLREEPESGRLVRSMPLPLSGPEGAAARLAKEVSLPLEVCEEALRRALLAGYQCRDEQGRPTFAFRLHQFVSKGDAVYASLEPEGQRHLTLQAQQFVPNSERSRCLLPLAFCRECGQEYYVVCQSKDSEGRIYYAPRELSDRTENDDIPGFLYLNTREPWPNEPEELLRRVPENWLEAVDGRLVVKKSLRSKLPREIFLSALAVEGAGNQRAHFLPAPFLFCLCCGVAYNPRQSSDFGKLSTLGSEGRSTATSVMSLSIIRRLRKDEDLQPEARKLLSFTDNRQDASLQAGHFNDFIGIALLRSALFRAVSLAGSEGVRHDELAQRVFEALALPLELYAVNPQVEYLQKDETERALREVLGYYLYQDLRRGWRITSPNLEQCGLLDIDYLSLSRFCADEVKWSTLHPALQTASPEEREHVSRVLLDFMRRELAIRVNYLDPAHQERIQHLSAQYLISPWSLGDQERLERSRIVLPRSRSTERLPEQYVFLSPRGGLGLYLKRPGIFPRYPGKLELTDVEKILSDLFGALTIPGILHRAVERRRDGELVGYQLNASAMLWRAGDGTRAFHDPVRVPNVPEAGLRTNSFFVSLYRQNTDDLKRLEAREHTAQVPARERKKREDDFREAKLPILYCSPTMELGVDIRQLNVVNLRNIPPTPANYAQRSGRAGRSGQPAFIFAYCSSGSPHDQYFFKHPELMVAGAVSTPRLDLKNEDLIRAHVHAVWLGIARLNLGGSMQEVLDVSGDSPTLALLPGIEKALYDPGLREKARAHARAALYEAIQAIVGPQGSVDAWLDQTLQELPGRFLAACERWKDLYRSALQQFQQQSRNVVDASRDAKEREQARRLRDEADTQLRLLLESDEQQKSDFNTYRYFAGEGFLPGYNFPRLPLSAYLPGRRRQKGEEDFLSRPRFLAISEFGPRSIIYHEGSRYVVNRVIFPVEGEGGRFKSRAAQCDQCGYLHPIRDRVGDDLCERCKAQLPPAFDNLFRMQNVSTRRRDRINSDEEERLRLGYELKTGVRFAQRAGAISAQAANLQSEEGEALATLTYGHAATLWRMNLGWRRRKNKDQLGYILDVERGYWARNEAVDDDPDDPLSERKERVIPYVEDTRNCLLIEPKEPFKIEEMASLEAALKVAIQVHFQLEDRELASEPLPGADNRALLLFYESSEGGAGVLRRLVEEPSTMREIARTALTLCHFDPDTLEDKRRAERAREDCEAACYDCLLSYYNQREHKLLDRHLLPRLLSAWARGKVETGAGLTPRDEHLEQLMRRCDSELERRWLRRVAELGLTLPSDAQKIISECRVKPDFLYKHVAVFIDGPHHDTPEQQKKDEEDTEALEDHGWTVLRFHHAADWDAIFARWPSVFGKLVQKEAAPGAPVSISDTNIPLSPPKEAPPPSLPSAASAEETFDLLLFDEEWHPLLEALLAHKGISLDAGEDVMHAGRVVGADLASVVRDGRVVRLIEDGPDADKVESALKAQGYRTLRVHPGMQDFVAKVLAALESE